jgi:hypothetical protein
MSIVMIRNLIILFIFFSISVAASSQQQEKYERTLHELIAVLRKKPTVPLQFHESPTYTADEKFYDDIISTYFNKGVLLTRLAKDTDVFAVEGKMDILRHMLNKYDQYLDVIPVDSIVIRPDEDSNLLIKVLIDKKEVSFLSCEFDPATNKLLMIQSIAGKEESEKLQRYQVR